MKIESFLLILGWVCIIGMALYWFVGKNTTAFNLLYGMAISFFISSFVVFTKEMRINNTKKNLNIITKSKNK